MGSIGCVRCKKFRRDFVLQTFALVRPNSPECNQILRNAPKRQFRVQLGGSGTFVKKMQPNSIKCTKTSFYGPTGWIGCIRCDKFRRDFVARTFALVRPSGPECNQTVRNTPKRHFRVQRGGSGAFIAKNSDATSRHELLQ